MSQAGEVVAFTVVQKNGKPKAKSSDATGDRDLAANPEFQVLKVPADTSNRPSEKINPPECKQADPTLAQSDSTSSSLPFRVRKLSSRFQDYVPGCIQDVQRHLHALRCLDFILLHCV